MTTLSPTTWEDLELFKVCSNCHQLKAFDEFHVQTRKKDGRQSECKLCRSDYSRQKHQELSDEEKKERSRVSFIQKQKRSLIGKALVIKKQRESGGCAVCGEQDFYNLDNDHLVKKEKVFSISEFVTKGYGDVDALQKELDKCQVLCKKCHAFKTAKDEGHYTYRLWEYEQENGPISANITPEELGKILGV